MRGQVLSRAAGNIGLSRNCIVVSIANVKVHFRCRTRRLGDDLHHAACRIAAEKCTLRPLQHLDPFDTVEFEQVSINGRLVDTIHIHRNGALCGRVTGRKSDTTQEGNRSEEHTSELQSLMRISYAVFCLKKKKNKP